MTGHPTDVAIDRIDGLPEPSLVVLVGPAGAGKHAWAARHFAPNEIVSLEKMRAVVGSHGGDHAATPDAQRILDDIVATRLRRALTVVVVTEGLEALRRRRWLRAAPDETRPFAFLFTTPLETCIDRNARSTRPVAASFIKRQALRTLEMGPQLDEEGFEVFLVQNPEA